MTRAATAITSVEDSHGAGQALGQQIRDAFGGAAPDAVVVFAAPHRDHTALGWLASVGCDSHGWITGADGQFSGFHNCTAVVCAIPR